MQELSSVQHQVETEVKNLYEENTQVPNIRRKEELHRQTLHHLTIRAGEPNRICPDPQEEVATILPEEARPERLQQKGLPLVNSIPEAKILDQSVPPESIPDIYLPLEGKSIPALVVKTGNG